LIRPRLEVRDGHVRPRMLAADYRYLNIAGELTTLFRRHVGRSRGALADAVRDYEGDSLDYPIIRGLAAVLEGRCTFNAPTLPDDEAQVALTPAALRASLFQQGPVTGRHDLFSQLTRPQALAETAAQFKLTPEEVELGLFADLAEEQILLDPGEPMTPVELIARYNLEVARGLLYWAREVRITVHDRYKDLFKYIKLFKLMYTIRPLQNGEPAGEAKPAGYQITLHGPISPFVQSTIRYGLQFAKFMPALLLGSQWHMEADVQPPGIPSREPLRYTLDDRTELRGHFKGSPLFDSRLEADFAAEFEEKYSGPKRKWTLAREDELIVVGDSVMIPDFSLTHRQDGRRALLELVGYWHPHYLQRKLAKVREAGREDLILLVYESANVAEGTFEAVAAGEVLTFSRKPVLKEVLAAAERRAVGAVEG
ncbi:MAG: DUF790 family protein, partial [Anaerolineae bacterium]|nr:DUF790 family protein [Anaerolineae bacterium]